MNRENIPVDELDVMQAGADADAQSTGAEESVDAQSTGAEESADAALLKAREETAELSNQLLRMRAEFDNFRRRVAKEKEELRDFATMESIRGILAVVDDFERALASECADPGYATGMQMIYSHLLDALKKQGVEKIDALGQPFDHNLHHAIDKVTTADAPDQSVLHVFQAGYRYKGHLLRPAVVKVAVAPDDASDDSHARQDSN